MTADAKPRVAVVGGGFAGMAAAAELAAAGVAVTVFEAARDLGGRARRIEIEGLSLDNGQHILIGAYRETLRLMRLVGADPQALLLRMALALEYPGEARLVTPRLPAPMHLAVALLSARGFNVDDKCAAIRFLRCMKRMEFRLPSDLPLDRLLEKHRQTETLRRFLWGPLCIAALNTPVELASAQIFVRVLQDSLGASRSDSDLLFPLTDMSRIFPEPAAEYVTARGGTIKRGVRVDLIRRLGDGFEIADGTFDRVVLAVGPYHVARLTEALPELDSVRKLAQGLDYEPIVTAYMFYPDWVRLSRPMLGFAGGVLQWLFDRGQLGGPAGLLAAVISAQGRHRELEGAMLAACLHGEINTLIPGLPPLLRHRVIVERRATFSCRPGLPRPRMATDIAGLLLAGDYVASEYPATIESAVRSGVNAARNVLGLARTAE